MIRLSILIGNRFLVEGISDSKDEYYRGVGLVSTEVETLHNCADLLDFRL